MTLLFLWSFVNRSWGGGVLDISLGGEVRPVPRTLTHFKTKLADNPDRISNFDTLFKKSNQDKTATTLFAPYIIQYW